MIQTLEITKIKVMLSQLFYIITLFHVIECSSCNHDLDKGIRYIKNYTRTQRLELIFWLEASISENVLDEVHSKLSNQDNDLQPNFMGVYSNQTTLIHDLNQPRQRSVVILSNFDQSRKIQKEFFELPVNLLKKHFWLLSLSNDYDNEKNMTSYFNELLSDNPNHDHKFGLNSKVFMI